MPLKRAVLVLVARKQGDPMPDTFRRFWCRVAGHSYIALPEFESVAGGGRYCQRCRLWRDAG